jgi:CheY-like chemotaxis protein/tetratricopeptide (TPR) repeat protein
MNLKAQLLTLRNQSRNTTLAERAELACSLAKQLEKAGDYEGAYEALSEFWPDPNSAPRIEGLDEPIKADLLLRTGALAGWRGGAEAEGDQETAKDLITQSIGIFEQLGQKVRLAEARGEIALCYWREGSYDEARIQLAEALSRLSNQESELRAILLIRAAIVEVDTQRFDQALRLYNEALPLVEGTEDHALKGSFHVGYGLLLRRLATPEDREHYMDRALIEYAAASFHFEQAGNTRALARVEANLGYLFFTIARYKDAHTHLDRARYLFLELKDVGNAAKVNDTRARTLLAEGHNVEAERIARAAVRTLQKGGEQAILAEALITHGLALARLGNHERAKALFQQSIQIAETAGAREEAGRAKLTIIEELESKIPTKELVSIYRSAIELLKGSQDPSAGKRLISCAEKLLDVVERLEPQGELKEHSWDGFSFRRHVRESERTVIERALRDAGGSVTRASRLLGFKHHQSLISIITSRHKDLLQTRSTVRRRRRHLFSEPRKIGDTVRGKHRDKSQITILHVEDNEAVKKLVQDILTAEGIHVDSCVTGTTGLELLKRHTRYDLLIVDNELPGLSGLELVLRAKSIAHRRNTPIIMLSGDDIEKEAWRAGVKAFLRKPGDIDRVSSTVARLLEERKEESN